MTASRMVQPPETPTPRSRFGRRWKNIAPRLLAGFLLPIVLTGVVGLIAVERFTMLNATTAELATRDLPEVIAVGHLRTLLFRQLDLDASLGGSLSTESALTTLIAAQLSSLRSLEPPDPGGNDNGQVHTLATGTTRAITLARRIQALRDQGKQAAATALDQSEAPRLRILLAAAARLRTLEEKEAVASASKAQGQSNAATQLVLALTLLSVPLSILLALLLTRSLTRPLSGLLRATEALARGDLETKSGVGSADEIGQLAAAFETMRTSLRTTIAALELERRQTQAIIDASSDGVILMDGDHRIMELNPAAERLTGWSPDKAAGQQWWTVCGCSEEAASELPWTEWVKEPGGSAGPRSVLDSPSSAAERQPDEAGMERSRTREEDVRSELLVRSRTGQERWLAFSCASVPWDGVAAEARLVLNLHDISELKAVDQLKSDFVAMVSHELRAPLTTVAGAVEMLVALDPSAEDGTHDEVIGILQAQTRRLRTVIEEVLQVTRLDAGRLPVRLEPVPIVDYLRALIERVRRDWIGGERRVSVQALGGETLVWADPGMLEIVFRNLLENANKYTPPDSPIEVDIRSTGPSGHVRICVLDHGPGIPSDQLNHIFQRFSRGVQSPGQWNRGYGLGLYIARELVRAHDGEIWAESREDGASFVVSLRAVASYETDRATEQTDDR